MAQFTGHLVLVVGPSGAGKDSVLRGAAAELTADPRFVFPRRIVTRAADADAEDHGSMDEMEFERAAADDAFALWWNAHGNSYGVPKSIEDELVAGRIVAVNVSRSVLAAAIERYPHVIVAEVTASPEILVSRIVARGRESEAEALKRVARKVPSFPSGVPVVRIVNNGELAFAIDEFCALLLRLLNAGITSPDWEDVEEAGDDDDGRLAAAG